VSEYDIKLDDKFGQLTMIDVAREAAVHEPWFNQTLTTVKETVVGLGVLEGEFHWHKHDHEDEFFPFSTASSSSRWRAVTRSGSARSRDLRCREGSCTKPARPHAPTL
jgi:hypothetical protein